MAISLTDSSAISNSQVASTLAHVRQKVEDNVSDATPLLSFLMGKLGTGMRGLPSLPGVIVGGNDIKVPVQLKQNTTVGSYSGRDTIDISEQDTDRYALFPIRQVSGSVSISGREKRANKGEAATYSLLQSKVDRMINDLEDNITTQCLSDGTGNNGKDIEGLAAVVATGTLAGLNPSTYPYWQPGGYASGNSRHAIDATTDFSSAGLGEMRRIYDLLELGTNDKPDFFLMAKNVIQMFETALTATGNGQIQYTTFGVGETGFEALRFKGGAVVADFAVADGTIYFLNSRHIALVRDSEGDFAWLGEMDRPVDQDVFVQVMVVEGNVVTDNRRALGVMTAVTA
jgi:hypothetical protein